MVPPICPLGPTSSGWDLTFVYLPYVVWTTFFSHYHRVWPLLKFLRWFIQEQSWNLSHIWKQSPELFSNLLIEVDSLQDYLYALRHEFGILDHINTESQKSTYVYLGIYAGEQYGSQHAGKITITQRLNKHLVFDFIWQNKWAAIGCSSNSICYVMLWPHCALGRSLHRVCLNAEFHNWHWSVYVWPYRNFNSMCIDLKFWGHQNLGSPSFWHWPGKWHWTTNLSTLSIPVIDFLCNKSFGATFKASVMSSNHYFCWVFVCWWQESYSNQTIGLLNQWGNPPTGWCKQCLTYGTKDLRQATEGHCPRNPFGMQ